MGQIWAILIAHQPLSNTLPVHFGECCLVSVLGQLMIIHSLTHWTRLSHPPLISCSEPVTTPISLITDRLTPLGHTLTQHTAT